MKKPTVLMILDGFGFNDSEYGNAVKLADTPNLDKYFQKYPHNIVNASGLDVGLPVGQMGNSEVGHLNIGAGRIVYQDITRINKSIEDGDFFKNPVLLQAIENVKNNHSALHLWGLVSDGGVHSHNTHLYALLELSKKSGLQDVYIHAFLDGRDVPPSSAIQYIEELEGQIEKIGVGKIATISGRYYAMDRDNRWDRILLAYNALVSNIGEKAASAKEAIEQSYAKEELDEFVKPTVIYENENPVAKVNPNDSVIMFNFRPDRAREITRAFVDKNFSHFDRVNGYFPLYYVCMTQYDAAMPNVHVAFKPQQLTNTLGEYISSIGLKQLRIAETEKYAHVTFFFNGGIEPPYPNENRILIPSPKVATYDLKPEMSAYEVTKQVIKEIHKKVYDFIVINYANPDMVGHTGSLEAAVKAIETVDECVENVINAILKVDGKILLTSDHGNSDKMLDAQGNTITAHSTSPVPIVLIDNAKKYKLAKGRLADIAPTLLQLMDIPQPNEMTGQSLLISIYDLADGIA
jgi:2,3-bisphosphoglycerate-independent phosphoglycerate mutase